MEPSTRVINILQTIYIRYLCIYRQNHRNYIRSKVTLMLLPSHIFFHLPAQKSKTLSEHSIAEI